ncbi:hypothetical protein DFQ27_009617 [Actinomortierella ambigua]|uniref:Uncharacterized protein n=1 Tax=Actinomortierella ambigua TaxID=1343610 RepID=A0A9P6UAS7_9FUNG|nr:hypothetical protein DFQ27_009617 [Actinomortierella ambigua]
MLSGPEYQHLVDKINRIRSIGLASFLSVPQIAIFGDQSSGKSSVLEATTKLSFPRDKGMCTRFATQVSLRHDPALDSEVLSARIEGETAFNATYRVVIPPTTFHDVISAAVQLLCRTSHISDRTLEITLSGPGIAPLTIIDLPGYINVTLDGQDKRIPDIIRKINRTYMSNPRTIILAVVPANVDLNNSYVLKEAEECDPKGERTIPVVTKPDTVEEDMLPELIDMILNKRRHMRLGYLVLRNSGYAGISRPWDEAARAEQAYFSSNKLWSLVPDAVKGRANVQKFLGNLLKEHIKKELPPMMQEIEKSVASTEQMLKEFAQSIDTPGAARQKLFQMVTKLQTSLTKVLNGEYPAEYYNTFNGDGHVDGHASGASEVVVKNIRFIRFTLSRLYAVYAEDMITNTHIPETSMVVEDLDLLQGSELMGFTSFSKFKQIFRPIHSEWKRLTTEHITSMHQFLAEAFTAFIAYDIPPSAHPFFLATFDRFYQLQVEKIESTLQDIFADHENPFTLDKYYTETLLSKQHNQSMATCDLIQQLVAPPVTDGLPFFIEALPLLTEEQPFMDVFHRLLEKGMYLRSMDVKNNKRKDALSLCDKLKIYCEVARTRIVDVVVLQTVERFMIRCLEDYYVMLSNADDADLRFLLESPERQSRRKELEQKRAILRSSLEELKAVYYGPISTTTAPSAPGKALDSSSYHPLPPTPRSQNIQPIPHSQNLKDVGRAQKALRETMSSTLPQYKQTIITSILALCLFVLSRFY